MLTLSTWADLVTALATVVTAILAVWLAFRPRDVALHLRVEWGRNASEPNAFRLEASPPFDGFGEVTGLRLIGPYEAAELVEAGRGLAGEQLFTAGPWGKRIPLRVKFQPNAKVSRGHFWLRPSVNGDWSRPAWAVVTARFSSPSPRTISRRIRIDTTH